MSIWMFDVSPVIAVGGSELANTLYTTTSYTETPNLNTAQIMVNPAADTLCSWVWANRAEPGLCA